MALYTGGMYIFALLFHGAYSIRLVQLLEPFSPVSPSTLFNTAYSQSPQLSARSLKSPLTELLDPLHSESTMCRAIRTRSTVMRWKIMCDLLWNVCHFFLGSRITPRHSSMMIDQLASAY